MTDPLPHSVAPRGQDGQDARWLNEGSAIHPQTCVLVEKHDYEGGDPSLDIERRPDGRYDLVIYRGAHDLTVHDLSADDVRRAAHRILALVPSSHDTQATAEAQRRNPK